jgi:hypothetical protein
LADQRKIPQDQAMALVSKTSDCRVTQIVDIKKGDLASFTREAACDREPQAHGRTDDKRTLPAQDERPPHFGGIICRRKHASFRKMVVEMRRVRCEHGITSPRFNTHALQALGMAAHFMNGDGRRYLIGTVMKYMAHTTSRRVGHLAVLQVIFCIRITVVISSVIVMQVRNDHVFDAVGLDSYRLEAIRNWPHKRTLAFLAHRLVEAGINDISALLADDRPDVVVERLEHIVRVAADIILLRVAIVMAVVDRKDFEMFLRRS